MKQIRQTLWLGLMGWLVTGSLAHGQRPNSPPREPTFRAETAPARVAAVLNLDRIRPVAERFAAVRALRETALSADEAAALRQYLRTPEPANGTEYDLKDVVLIRLEQEQPAAEMIELLERMYADRAQPRMMRDYALQHLPPAHAKGAPQDRQRIAAILREALAETDTQIAGTALLMMHRIVTTAPAQQAGVASAARPDSELGFPAEPAIASAEVAQTALQLASNPTCSVQTRVTAVQVCAELRVPGVLNLATDLAQHADSVPLRIAAIAALGDMGGPSQKVILENLAESDDRRVKIAAASARRRLEGRVNNQNRP